MSYNVGTNWKVVGSPSAVPKDNLNPLFSVVSSAHGGGAAAGAASSWLGAGPRASKPATLIMAAGDIILS